MTPLQTLSQRFARADLTQLSTLLFVLLVITLAFTWPGSGLQPNDSWESVAQLRLIALTLLATGYGASTSTLNPLSKLNLAQKTRQLRLEQRTTLAALSLLAILSAPLEVAAYAASYPSQALAWSLGLALLDTIAMFGVGLGLGRLLSILRLRVLLPLAVPAVLAGLITLDLALGMPLGSPLAALAGIHYGHLVLMGTVAVITLFILSQSAHKLSAADAAEET